MSGGILSQRDIVVSGMFFPRCKLEYDVDDMIIYKGTHYVHGAAEGHQKWMITKYTYDGTNITDIEQLEGSWTDRATLDWI